MPKSDIFSRLRSPMRMFRAARSRWMMSRLDKYSCAMKQISLVTTLQAHDKTRKYRKKTTKRTPDLRSTKVD